VKTGTWTLTLILTALILLGVSGPDAQAQAVLKKFELEDKTSEVEFGGAVDRIPDVTGDDISDLIVSAPRGPTRVEGEGRVFLIDGAEREIFETLSSLNPTNQGRFGQDVAGLPDVNNDGVGDLVVGAPNEVSSDKEGEGEAYVISGESGVVLLATGQFCVQADEAVASPESSRKVRGSYAFEPTNPLR
jgi:FG-GAP repeat.